MLPSTFSPEAYASLLLAVASTVLPFFRSNGHFSVPLFTWLAASGGLLLLCQVFRGDEAGLPDIQKNLGFLDEQETQKLGLCGSAAHVTSHMALLKSAQLRHHGPVTYNDATNPLLHQLVLVSPDAEGLFLSSRRGGANVNGSVRRIGTQGVHSGARALVMV